MERLETLLARIDAFNKERDWDQFHSPANLAKSISIEAGELLECFQWNEAEFDVEAVKQELADVMNYCLQLAMKLGVDPIDIMNAKMEETARKYPVTKARGVATKYTKFGD